MSIHPERFVLVFFLPHFMKYFKRCSQWTGNRSSTDSCISNFCLGILGNVHLFQFSSLEETLAWGFWSNRWDENGPCHLRWFIPSLQPSIHLHLSQQEKVDEHALSSSSWSQTLSLNYPGCSSSLDQIPWGVSRGLFIWVSWGSSSQQLGEWGQEEEWVEVRATTSVVIIWQGPMAL